LRKNERYDAPGPGTVATEVVPAVGIGGRRIPYRRNGRREHERDRP
jgi:hypothetical protein